MIFSVLSRLLLALVATATLSLGSAYGAESRLPQEIRIGVPDQSAGSKPFIGGPLGLAHIRQQLEAVFAPQGIKVTWSFFKGAGPAVNEALANQQLDFAYLGDLAAIIGRANGLPTRLLLGNRGSDSYLAVNKKAGIKQLSDLKGKRVAVYRGTADQLAFDQALARVGLNERDLQVINLDWTAGKAALAADRIDAVWGGVSLLTLRGDKVDVAVKSGDLGRNNTTQAGFLATQTFIDRWPELTQQLVDVLVKNDAWISDSANLDAYTQALSQQSQVPQALFLEGLKPNDLNFKSSPRLDAFLHDSFAASVKHAKDANLIRKDFDVDSWFEGRFVEQALKNQQLEHHWPRFDAQGQPDNNG